MVLTLKSLSGSCFSEKWHSALIEGICYFVIHVSHEGRMQAETNVRNQQAVQGSGEHRKAACTLRSLGLKCQGPGTSMCDGEKQGGNGLVLGRSQIILHPERALLEQKKGHFKSTF